MTASHDDADRLGPTRRRVLAHLQEEANPSPIEALSAALGLHANTVRFHLDALLEDGLVRRVTENRTRQGRPRVLFTATPSVPPVSDVPYQGLVSALLAHVRAIETPEQPVAEQIGEDWGRSLVTQGQVTSPNELVAVVNGLGLTSRLATTDEGLQLQIVRCPFRDMTITGDTTVCRIHLGLMRGYLAAGGADYTANELIPWVTPELCVATFEKLADQPDS